MRNWICAAPAHTPSIGDSGYIMVAQNVKHDYRLHETILPNTHVAHVEAEQLDIINTTSFTLTNQLYDYPSEHKTKAIFKYLKYQINGLDGDFKYHIKFKTRWRNEGQNQTWNLKNPDPDYVPWNFMHMPASDSKEVMQAFSIRQFCYTTGYSNIRLFGPKDNWTPIELPHEPNWNSTSLLIDWNYTGNVARHYSGPTQLTNESNFIVNSGQYNSTQAHIYVGLQVGGSSWHQYGSAHEHFTRFITSITVTNLGRRS